MRVVGRRRVVLIARTLKGDREDHLETDVRGTHERAGYIECKSICSAQAVRERDLLPCSPLPCRLPPPRRQTFSACCRHYHSPPDADAGLTLACSLPDASANSPRLIGRSCRKEDIEEGCKGPHDDIGVKSFIYSLSPSSFGGAI